VSAKEKNLRLDQSSIFFLRSRTFFFAKILFATLASLFFLFECATPQSRKDCFVIRECRVTYMSQLGHIYK